MNIKNTFFAVLLLVPAAARAAGAPCACDRCIAVYGDSRSGNDAHRKLAALIAAVRPAVVIHTGDLVPKGTDARGWADFREITAGLRASASYYAVLGNHEKGGEDAFTGLFHYPGNGRWYSVDARGVRFIMLDYLSPLGKGGPQAAWLERELARPRRGVGFTAVVMHKPLLSTGHHGHDSWPPAAWLERLFRANRVDLVISGHDHDYERLEKDGLVQLVSGGGGAKLYAQEYKSPYSRVYSEANHYILLSVCGGRLKGEVFGLSGEKIDAFTIPGRPAARPARR